MYIRLWIFFNTFPTDHFWLCKPFPLAIFEREVTSLLWHRSKITENTMHISFLNNDNGSNNSNVPLHANLARSEVRGTSPTILSAMKQYIAASWGMTSSSRNNNILLRRSESVKWMYCLVVHKMTHECDSVCMLTAMEIFIYSFHNWFKKNPPLHNAMLCYVLFE